MQFSMVILCYRAEDSIIPFVEKLHALFEWTKIDYELVLVGNYSVGAADRTPEVVQALAARLSRTRCITLPKQGNMGWDLKSGIDAAKGEYVGMIDGDGQFPIDSILPALYHATVNGIDLVKTYRVVRGDGVWRRLISFVYNGLFRILFKTKYQDVNSKPKIIRRSILQSMNLASNDWFIDAEMMIQANRMNLNVYEFPIHFVANKTRASFVKVSAIWEFITNLYRYWK